MKNSMIFTKNNSSKKILFLMNKNEKWKMILMKIHQKVRNLVEKCKILDEKMKNSEFNTQNSSKNVFFEKQFPKKRDQEVANNFVSL